MKALEPFPNVRDYLIQMRFKPKPRYDAGLFLGLGKPELEASLVGEMIPQPEVAGAAPMLLDDALGPGFALIAQDGAGAAALARLERAELMGLPLARVVLDTAGRGEGVQACRSGGGAALPHPPGPGHADPPRPLLCRGRGAGGAGTDAE